MGNLKYHVAYTCGPIDKAPDAGVIWREEITPFLRQLGIIVLDPCKKSIRSFKAGIRGESKEDIAYINQLKAEKKWDDIHNITKQIRNVDLRCVDKSDFLIVNFDTSISMAGTHEEIVTANRSKKAVLMMCPQGIENISSWYHAMLPHEFFFDCWDSLKQYLIDVDSGKPCSDRWVLFDLDKQIEETCHTY